MKEQIPLSWTQNNTTSTRFEGVKLKLSGLEWIYSAQVPAHFTKENLFSELQENYHNGYLLRGCGPELASFFSDKGHGVVRTGAEAIIDLDDLSNLPKSLKDLVSRGSKYGHVRELVLNNSNGMRVRSFINQTPYAGKAKLQYLFNTDFDSNARCFVMSSSKDKWLGAITVSQSSTDSCHTELLLRDSNARVGVMEYLLANVMGIYRDKGFKFFSLGEVPFISPVGLVEPNLKPSYKRSVYENFLFKSGHILRYAFDYKGLFDFKNKFDPQWKPVYICAAPNLDLTVLFDLFIESGYLSLSRSELISKLKLSYQN